MNKDKEKAFINTRTCKVFFLLVAVSFALMCADRVKRACSAGNAGVFPGIIALLAVLALVAVAWKAFNKRGYEAAVKPLAWILALACASGFRMHMPEQEKSAVWFVIYALCASFLSSALMKPSSRKARVSAAVLGGIFAAIVLVGGQLKSYDRLELLYDMDLERISTALFRSSGEALLFTAALNYIFAYALEKGVPLKRDGKINAGRIVLYALFILICWLPYYYAMYPGNLSNDSINEIRQQLGMIPQTNNHPYLHQLLIGLCFKIGGSNHNLGVGIYSALQMLLMAFSFAFCIGYIESRGIKKGICIGALCFYALFPVNAFYSITMWKNVLHAGIGVVFMVLLTMQITEKHTNKRKRLILNGVTILFGFLFCTFVNNAWYAFLLGFPLYILFNKSQWKKLGAIFLTVVVAVTSYYQVLYAVMDVEKPATGEILSVPLQQIARVAKFHPEELESEEFGVFEEIFYNVDSLGDRYISFTADPVKLSSSFNVKAFDAAPLRYLKCWAQLGLRHPLTYVEAFLLENYGYWYPDVDYVIVFDHISADAEGLGLSQISRRHTFGYELGRLNWELNTYSPMSFIYCLGFTMWILLTAAVTLVLKGQRAVASPLVIMAVIWAGTLFAPVHCEYRYLYGLVCCVPMYLGLAFGLEKKKTDALPELE